MQFYMTVTGVINTHVSRGVGFLPLFVHLCFCMISQKLMQLG